MSRPDFNFSDNLDAFSQARLGVFVHFGLYSLLGRGEWALNREKIPFHEYRALAERFTASAFDADALATAAKQAGAKYLTFTTMHHDGFCLYGSEINPFNTVNTACGRDLVGEVVEACRRHGLRVHLYHSLNHWTAEPDAVAALESADARKRFVDHTHERIRELVQLFNPIDCLWYDGWWPFDAAGWRAEEMNHMVRAIQPHILFNGRNGLPGDFATPEQHLTTPLPWRPWEACITHNRNWGFHRGDRHWKNSDEIIDALVQVAQGAGNLLINVGPDGDGCVPKASRRMLKQVGRWMRVNAEAIYGSEPFTFDLREQGDHRGDFHHHGRYTVKGDTLYIHLLSWPGETFSIAGTDSKAQVCRLLGTNRAIRWSQTCDRITFFDLPCQPLYDWDNVVAVQFDRSPNLYLTGGMRTPTVAHPRYNPYPPDLAPTRKHMSGSSDPDNNIDDRCAPPSL